MNANAFFLVGRWGVGEHLFWIVERDSTWEPTVPSLFTFFYQSLRKKPEPVVKSKKTSSAIKSPIPGRLSDPDPPHLFKHIWKLFLKSYIDRDN